MKTILTGFLAAALAAGTAAAETVRLPPPDKTGGMTLSLALAKRHTGRKIALTPLPLEMLSNLLWSANGRNRSDKLTAPTARNRQEMTLYYLCTEGCYRYNEVDHSLETIGEARYYGCPTIAIVADLRKQPKAQFCDVDAGFIGQNIYLFAAANHLETVFKATFPEAKLRQLLKLTKEQRLCYIQEIGLAKKD